MNIVNYFKNAARSTRLIENQWRRLYRVAYSWSQDPHLSADLVQETLTKAFRNRRQLSGAEALDKWLYRILANCWHDYWRQHKEAIDISDVALTAECDPVQDCELSELAETVRAAMARLNREQREVVALVDLEGMAYHEVGEILGIPVGTVKSRLFRAREQLEQTLSLLDAGSIAASPAIRRIK